MPTAYASAKSSKDGDADPSVDTKTSGANASAAASSKNKDGDSFFQISKTTRNRDGTQTEKMSGRRGADEEKDSNITPQKLTAKKNDETDSENGVFAKAGNAFAAAGGAVASAAGGRAAASAE